VRILVHHTHTLYAKATLPVVIELAERGHDVVVARRRDRWRSFSEDYVRLHPTTVKAVDDEALRFASRITGLAQEWQGVQHRVAVERPRGRFDVVLGTTKDIYPLRALAARHGARAIALGYQHMPFLLAVAGELQAERRPSALLERNAFTEAHRFTEILNGIDHAATGFTFLDAVHGRSRHVRPADEVLILHSGGWRGIETLPREPRDAAYAKQEALLERACLPALEAGLRPIVKVHPLRARDHDAPDVERIARRLELRHGLADGSIGVLGPEDWAWDRLLGAALVVGYGSSSLYELWSAGIRSAVVCDFEGTARSEKFRLFPSIVLESHVQYVSLMSTGGYRTLELDPLAELISHAYAELGDGGATERAVRAVESLG
jgi:hypothetical protein